MRQTPILFPVTSNDGVTAYRSDDFDRCFRHDSIANAIPLVANLSIRNQGEGILF
jgi:hypothetical protein